MSNLQTENLRYSLEQQLFKPDQYELIDFGDGKKLESFAGIEVLRACPAATTASWRYPRKTDTNYLSYCRSRKSWSPPDLLPENWQITHPVAGTFALKATPFGHVGIFSEQAENWDWIAQLPVDLTRLNALNLFAYTGGTTMALARRGASVVHVDAARNVVSWARRNAELSKLGDRPIRWITDDAIKYINREIKREKKYDIVVADPPAFGHGGKKMSWKFHRDIEPLVESLAQLITDQPTAILFSCHTNGFDGARLRDLCESSFGTANQGNAWYGSLDLTSRDGRPLNCGHCYRWHCQVPESVIA